MGEAKQLSAEPAKRQKYSSIVNIAATYKRCPVQVLGELRFKDLAVTYRKLLSMRGVQECCIIQTCNRVEITVVTDPSCKSSVAGQIIQYWKNASREGQTRQGDVFEVHSDENALLHLLRLSSGLDSMIIGEAQILGQVKNAFNEAKKRGAIGTTLEAVMTHIIRVGAEVRKTTAIGKGSVSVGAIGVRFAEMLLGSLEGKRALLIGAGEIMKPVRDALAKKSLSEIYVAGRRLEKAKSFAAAVAGNALTFSEAARFLGSVDLAVVATNSPNILLTKKEVLEAREEVDKPLLILDMSNPRNVGDDIAALDGVKLTNLDSLREVAEENLANRREEAKKAEQIIKREAEKLVKILKKRSADPLIATIFSSAEDLRRREVGKALRRIKSLSDQDIDVLDELTTSIVEGILSRPASQLRIAAINGDKNTIEAAEKIFLEKGPP